MMPASSAVRGRRRGARYGWLVFGVVVLQVAAGAGMLAAAGAWTVKDAPYRAVFRLQDAPTDPEAGIVLALPEFGQTKPGLGDLALTDSSGVVQPLAAVYSRPGEHALVLALTMRSGEDYYLYCGGTRSRVGPGWTPKTSVLMETRLVPGGQHCESWADMDNLWRRTQSPCGGDFVPHVYHSGNPFGRDSDFITHYTGYLNPPAGNSVFLFTASADASFVLVNDRFEFGWPGKHSGEVLPTNLRGKAVPSGNGPLKIDYYHVKGAEDYAPAMVLGWTVAGVPQTIPPGAWLHPGSSQLTAFEEVNGQPVPRIATHVKSYLGYGGEWYYLTDYGLAADPPAGWTANWQFADGVTRQTLQGSRVLTGADPQMIGVKILHEAATFQGVGCLHFPDGTKRADVNQPGAVRDFVDLAAVDDLAAMSAEAARARVILFLDFGTDEQVARFSPGLLAADRTLADPLSARAAIVSIQAKAETDPRRALEMLRALPANLREKDDAIAQLEVDLLVFYLRDPSAESRATQLSFSKGDTDSGRRLLVRAGDAARLEGRYDDAVARYQKAAPARVEPTKAAAQDQAYALTVTSLLDEDQREEAAAKLAEWEIRHPPAKLSTDFLLLRARVAMRYGRWQLARTELESFAKMMPESPYQIDTQFYLAQALAGSGKAAEARAIWEKLARDYPNSPLATKSKDLASGKQP